MQRVDREVEENLNEVRTVDFGEQVFLEGMDDQFVLMRAGMDLQQFAEVGQDLIGADGGPFGGAIAQETEVALGDFDAIVDLPGDAGQPVFDQLQAASFEGGGAADVLVDDLDEARDDGQRPVDVVDDAGVDFALGPDDFLLQLLVVEFFLEFVQLLVVGVDLLGNQVAFHRVGNGGAHGGNVERLGQIIARSQPQRLPSRFNRLVGSQHDDLDRRIYFLELAQQFDSRHPGHADVQHRRVHGMLLHQFDGFVAVVRQQDVVVVLEDDAERLPRALFVVHDQQRTFWFRDFVRRGDCSGSGVQMNHGGHSQTTR